MASQFSFLTVEFPEVFALAARAEGLARNDPRAACFYSRLALETALDWLYRHDGALKTPYDTTLSALIHEPTFRQLVGVALTGKARAIKDLGNRAVHETRAVPPTDGAASVRELFHFCYWLARTYCRGEKPPGTITFSLDALPRNASVPVERLDQLHAAADRYIEAVKAREEAERQRQESEAGRAALEAELASLRAQVEAAKAANQKVPDPHDYKEAETRDLFIDLLLSEAGWSFAKPGHDTEFEVQGMPNAKGVGYVDYVLWGDDGKPLALVEAKRTSKDPMVGQQQAKLYADCLEQMFSQRPVIFCSNGYEHFLWDDRRYPPRPVAGFFKKDELELIIRRRSQQASLAATPIDKAIVERSYQTRAIRRVTETFEKDKGRKALLVMATGSGKTRTVIALTDVLMKANWARRVLFLADRRALVNQAVGAFKKFLPSASPVNLMTEREATGRVYVSTYQTMIKLIDEREGGLKRFGPGHFDLIVIDEAHRSVYKKYGAIFDYFDSFLVGLTATPKTEIDKDTYRLFGLEKGVPTDAYGLEEAVEDGYLVPFKAISVPLKFQREGIRYDDLTPEEQEAWDALEWDEDGEVPDTVDAAAVNKWLFNTDTVDKVLEHLMTHGQKVAEGDRLGKTIIFAKNQDHAHFIRKRFDAAYPHLAGIFARVIISSDPYAQSLIDDFSQADKAPHIAISVDMLDTGIDVPEVVNLVFFKVVRSKTKFWQMIGRGTRLCEDLLGPGRHKVDFRVFDYCQNFEFFNQNPELSEGGVAWSLGERLFVARLELLAVLDNLPALGGGDPDPLTKLREEIADRLHAEVSEMSLENFLVRKQRRAVEKFSQRAAWQALSQEDRETLARDVASLPSGLADDDLPAKQFDAILLRAELAALTSDPSLERLRKQIVATAGLLEELGNIPMVAAQMELIQEVQTDQYWQDVTAPILDAARKRLRGLISLIELKKRDLVYTDFEDEIGEGTEIALSGATVGADMSRFRMKARMFLKEHADHIAILKLRRNEPLTPTDLSELERMFIEAGVVDVPSLDQVKSEGGLGLFVRSLVGLDREAAKAAFSEFIAERTLSADQIEFVNLIIDHLTEKGQMDPGLLYESPFTDFDPMGVSGVFDMADAKAVVAVLQAVRGHAAA